MARYSWETKSLLNALKRVQKLIDKETDEVELARLYHYYDVVNSTIYDTFCYPNPELPLSKKMPDKVSSFLANQRYYHLLEPFDRSLAENADLYNEVLDKREDVSDQIKKATGTYVTKEKAVSICYDFYKDLDEELFEHFKKFYDMRFNHLRFIKPKDAEELDYLGIHHYLYGVDESFIEVVGHNNPRMTTTMIHESAHAIDSSMNPDNYLSSDYFYEVISIFMQLVSYYKRAGDFDELYYYDSLTGYLSSYDTQVGDAYLYSDIMHEYVNNHYHISPEFYEAIRKEYNMSKKKVNSFLKETDPSDMCYPISLSLALAFFNIYKQDEKKGIENLKRFIRTTKREDYIPLVLSDELGKMVDKELKDLLTESKECFERHAK